MKTKIIFILTCFFTSSIAFSQTVNYAIDNPNGKEYIETATIEELNNSREMTLQMWIKSKQTAPEQQLLTQNNFSIKTGEHQNLVFQAGSQSVSIACSLPLNEWVQLTVTFLEGTVKAYVNNIEQNVTGTLAQTLPEANSTCIIGKNFKGEIDEIRIWKKALEMKDFFWRNTLNKFNPNSSSLIAYWKCDQELCEHLVDYQFRHHGMFKGEIVRKAVNDNANFRYRIVTGYTSALRFIDRPFINRDMFHMTNDLVFITAKAQKDGSIKMEYPDNSCTPKNVTYLKSFEGHKGVLDFQGRGASMTASDGEVFFSPVPTPTDKFIRASVATASFGAWIYIDSWKEGAIIFEKKENTESENTFSIALGPENEKSIVVNLCGTIATLKDKVQTGKWHYLGVYLRPKPTVLSEIGGRVGSEIITIGVDFTEYKAPKGLSLSGKDMTLKSVPALGGTTPLVIGKNFDGKMDEVMVWGALRNTKASQDAKGIRLNVGNSENIALTAYWKGDDPKNIGKDTQSYTGMLEFMRNYYAGYRGIKFRFAIVYPEMNTWREVLNKKANVDRFIRDAKNILTHFDGMDVDLEWGQYDVLNPLIKRLLNEVVAGTGKIFTVSQQELHHTIDKSLIDKIDYFTFQLYGLRKECYDYDWFVNTYNLFKKYGYPDSKILLSYGNLMTAGTEHRELAEEGYKNILNKGINDDNYNPDQNSLVDQNGVKWYFNGVNQIKKKQNFIIDNDLPGTMYFDMGNDFRVDDYKSLIRAQNEVIASNVDTLITQVNMDPTAISPVSSDSRHDLFSFYPNPAKDKIELILPGGTSWKGASCTICTTTGETVMETGLNSYTNIISLPHLEKGIYLITVNADNKTHTAKLYIK